MNDKPRTFLIDKSLCSGFTNKLFQAIEVVWLLQLLPVQFGVVCPVKRVLFLYIHPNCVLISELQVF